MNHVMRQFEFLEFFVALAEDFVLYLSPVLNPVSYDGEQRTLLTSLLFDYLPSRW